MYLKRYEKPSLDKLEIINFLGKGSFAEVWLVQHVLNCKLYAMKRIKKAKMIAVTEKYCIVVLMIFRKRNCINFGLRRKL